jgi:hypothetical protein
MAKLNIASSLPFSANFLKDLIHSLHHNFSLLRDVLQYKQFFMFIASVFLSEVFDLLNSVSIGYFKILF